MRPGENFNHPRPGSIIRVEPIRRLKDIQTIKRLLADRPRDLALFTIGINTNLRASDLVRIKAGQVRSLSVMDELVLREKKTGKIRRVPLNKSCIEAIRGLLASRSYRDDDTLFSGHQRPLTVPTVTRLVKRWCLDVNLGGNYGSHTLRKTWGYHQRVSFGRGLPELMVCFNHGSQRQTLEYLCVQPDEIRSVYANEL